MSSPSLTVRPAAECRYDVVALGDPVPAQRGQPEVGAGVGGRHFFASAI